MKKKSFILAYDIPTNLPYFKKKINRLLRKMNAKMVQRSLWSSEDLEGLIKIAILIKNAGGKARIMEEKLIFE